MPTDRASIQRAFRQTVVDRGRTASSNPPPTPADRALIIGTDPTCDIRINDPYASNRHAQVWRAPDGQVWIEDLGSTNGTWLGGGPLQGGHRIAGPTPIGSGVVVRIGRTDIPWTEEAS